MKKESYILIVVVVMLGIYIAYDQITAAPSGSFSGIVNLSNEGNAPELEEISGFFNTDEVPRISELRGKVVLIDFWTYTCINCIRTLPHLVEWDKKYRDKGLVIIGVHTPEFEFEKKKENVENAIRKYEIEYIVVQDNDYATWRNYGNRYWPHKYLIDKNGNIVYDHIGEGAYEETERKIQELLGEEMEISNIEDKTPRRRTTPELYAGYTFALRRGQLIGNEFLGFDTAKEYILSKEIKDDIIYLEGRWLNKGDGLEAKGDGAIVLKFTAHEVNIVADSLRESEMKVFVDGKGALGGDDVNEKFIVKIDEPRLYNVVRGEYGTYLLRLEVEEGFSFNAFTFG